MTLTDEQIDYIDRNLKFYGVASDELRNDITDHICTYIEQGDFDDFETAYREALQKFGGYPAVGNLQRETYLQVTFTKIMKQKKALYISTLIAVSLFLTGILFKTFHWPGAMIMLFLSIATIILFVLPLFLYNSYETTKRKLYKNQ